MKPLICTVANQKGGVGKTTTAVTLAHGLALRGKDVLLVDCDPQGQAASFLGLRQESGLFDLLISRRPVADVTRTADTDEHARPHLHLIPGDKRTATAQVVLGAEGFDLAGLANALRGVVADYIIFDTSPSVGLLQESAMFASDILVAPVATDYPSAEGLAGVVATLQAVNNRGGHCRLAAVVPTMFDDVTKESRANLAQLQESFGAVVLPPVHRATVLRECAAEGCTIWEKDAGSRAAQEYARLVWEVHDYAKTKPVPGR